jgi:hypothetical protein
MSEYVITPDRKDPPSGHVLMEELHRRGLPVEISVKGTVDKWESIRFTESGPPETECQLTLDPSGTLKASISVDSNMEARDLQMVLVDVILAEVGGRADHTATRERYTAEQFARKVRDQRGRPPSEADLPWIVFSWAMVGVSLMGFCVLPRFHYFALVAAALSLVGALGLTWQKTRG